MNKLLIKNKDLTIKEVVIDSASFDFDERHGQHEIVAVSYTHLTLPTIYSV